jgi:hypothetical protein
VRSAGNVWITSSSSTNAICAGPYRAIFNTIMTPARIFRSTKTVHGLVPSNLPRPAISLPTQRSAVCTIAISVEPLKGKPACARSYLAQAAITLILSKDKCGLPTMIRVDQGSQFTSKELDLWAYANGVTLDFSRPGKPTDNANAYVESFNATVRLECLGRHWFLDLNDAREKIEEWRTEYNEVRPHSAIGDRTPMSLIHRPQYDAEVANRPEILS